MNAVSNEDEGMVRRMDVEMISMMKSKAMTAKALFLYSEIKGVTWILLVVKASAQKKVKSIPPVKRKGKLMVMRT
jgi:hypothetical protein